MPHGLPYEAGRLLGRFLSHAMLWDECVGWCHYMSHAVSGCSANCLFCRQFINAAAGV